jgi:hypothetical protein
MAKRSRRVRRLVRRSDYEDALVRYHAAKRRGDSADAGRWLKVADMHLRVADRFAEGAHVALLRETTEEKAKEKFALMMQEQRSGQKAPVDTYAALEKHLAEAERRWLEEAEEGEFEEEADDAP